MDDIKVGDVFKHNDFNIFVMVAGCRLRHLDDKIQIDFISDDGSAIYTTDDYISKNYHKVGHIEKFAEALKELEEMAKNLLIFSVICDIIKMQNRGLQAS